MDPHSNSLSLSHTHSHSRSRNNPTGQNTQAQTQPSRATNTNPNTNNYQTPIQSQDIQPSHVLRETFYNPSINDPFNAYIHADNDASFNHNWEPAESIQNYGPGSDSWNPNVLQSSSNLLTGSDFALQSRNFDQTYSRTQPVDYDTFPSPNPALTTSSFDPTFVPFGTVQLPDDANFNFSHQAFRTETRPSETISPQALQAYPTATFSRVQIPEPRPVSLHPDQLLDQLQKIFLTLTFSQSQKYSDQPPRAAQRAPGDVQPAQTSITNLGWRSSVSAIPKGSVKGGFLIKDPAQLKSATDSTHFKGFVFVGNEAVELGTTKGRPLRALHAEYIGLTGVQQIFHRTILGDR